MERKYEKYIHKLQSSSLDSVPFHKNMEGITRLSVADFPFHLAVHKIDISASSLRDYVQPHSHEVPEINLILADKQTLVYRIMIGGEEYVVPSPAVIWIPENVPHSANILEGSGHYVCILFEKDYKAKGDDDDTT
ncbi:MAG: hypothetical protein ABIE94_06075 [archaeon]